jgi:prolyl oligopeptidase PreP (S9A serine peptidase family)
VSFTHSGDKALLGNPRWEKRLLKFLEKTTVGKVGLEKIEDEIRRVPRYEEWCNLVEDSDAADDEAFIYLISFTVPQPCWLCRQKQKQIQKQKQTKQTAKVATMRQEGP